MLKTVALVTLAAGIALATPAVSQDAPDFADVIENRYFQQWRDTPEHPFSMEIAQQIYLTDDRLTALDTDALAVPGADSRLEGWAEYAPIWPKAFEGISRFEPGEVRDLLVRPQGNWALVTFDMTGELELTDGTVLDVFKHFTLVWVRTPDGWRIMHEHISDGKPAAE
ncbi:MAG: nuclear transport factor 2 family protein [Pseudomonadota bacterium]